MSRGKVKSFDVNHKDFKTQQILVESWAAGGHDLPSIANKLNCSRRTLQRYFQNEIDAGHNFSNSNVKAALYRSCMRGNVAAQIVWRKFYAGDREMDHRMVSNAPPVILMDEVDDRVNPAHADFVKSAAADNTEE